jgi:hypothetical protein
VSIRQPLHLALLLTALVVLAPSTDAQYAVLWWDNTPEWGSSFPDSQREEMADHIDGFTEFDCTYVSSEIAGELALELAANSYDVIIFDSAGYLTFDAADRAAVTTHYATKPHLLLDGSFSINASNIATLPTFPGPGDSTAGLLMNEVWQVAVHGGGMVIGTDHFGFSDPANDVLDQCVPAADFTGATLPSADALFHGTDLVSTFVNYSPYDLFPGWWGYNSQGIAPTGSFVDVFGNDVTLYSQLDVADAPGGGTQLCYISTSWPPTGGAIPFDCDGNGVLDSIDIDYGWLDDDDGDGYPDDCVSTPLVLYTVSDQNVLTKLDVDNGCVATAIGVTQDSQSGPVRKLRGLTYDPVADVMYGMTREGDLVTVDRTTGTTTHLMQLPFGDPATEFWGGLTFDGVDTLYTANAYDFHELVKITLGTNPSASLVGQTLLLNYEEVQLLGLDLYPPSAPPPVTHPVQFNLWVSNRDHHNIAATEKTNGLTDLVYGLGGMGLEEPQAVAFHPGTGELYSLHDHAIGATNAALATFDFVTGVATELCELPFGIIETGSNPSYGWGGLAFAPDPDVWTSPWAGQGSGLPGASGVPVLVGSGPLVEGSLNALDLSKAAPDGLAMLFFAFSSTPVPFKGGTLVPFPDPGQLLTKTSPAGTIAIPFVMPAGVPVGTELWTQWAIQDAAAIKGVALSNAVLGVTR